MDLTIYPNILQGAVNVIPSKSQAHRLLICAAFADAPTELICSDTNRDIEATAACLRALGANIVRTEQAYTVYPIHVLPEKAILPCGESGSTLRFLLPVVGALGVDATFILEGRLPQRPLSPLWEEMEWMGCHLSRPTENTVRCRGKLFPGEYRIDGGISSQFISGLMFAAALINGDSSITVTGTLESKPYVDMTRQSLQLFHAPNFRTPGKISAEGDWSNGAFWLTAQMLGNPITVHNLQNDSIQGDRAILDLLPKLKENFTISAKDIPDLVPILSVAAAANQGAVFTDIARLRLKESDRVASTIAMIQALGGQAYADDHTLTVLGTGLRGGTVDSYRDHRIAMSAAIASTVCTDPVMILGAESVEKSYPKFWDEFSRLGGNYEQYLR